MSKATHVTLLDPASRELVPHVLVEGPHGTQVHRYDRGGPLVLILGHDFAAKLAEHAARQVVTINTADGISADEASAAGEVLAEYLPEPEPIKIVKLAAKKVPAKKK